MRLLSLMQELRFLEAGGNAQKSFAFFARGQYGTSEFDYPFFSELNYSKFQSFIMLDDGTNGDIVANDGTYSAALPFQSRSIASYVNGEYWGLYNMREKVNEHFIASKANVDPEDVDLLTNNAEIVHGTNEDYINLRNFISEIIYRTPPITNMSQHKLI